MTVSASRWPILLALLALAGCARGGEDAIVPQQAAQPKPEVQEVQPLSPAPDPELEALGIKVFGEHQHTGSYTGPHYRKEETWYEIEDRIPSEEEMNQRRAQPRVVAVEIREEKEQRRGKEVTARYIVTTRLIDLWSQADERAWKEEMAGKYLVQGDIGRYRSSGRGSAARGLTGRGRPTIDAGCAHMTILMTAPRGDMFHASVFAGEAEPALMEHEFERRVLRNGDGMRTETGQYVVKYRSDDEGGQGAMWSTGKGVYVSVVAGKYPEEVIVAYLKKHPSALTRDYRVDEGKWLEAEIGYRFRWMDEALAMEDAREARDRFSSQVTLFREDFRLPSNGDECRDVENCRQTRKRLAEWWEANKGKLHWDQKAGKFEVGG
jgi:hypothetical protein